MKSFEQILKEHMLITKEEKSFERPAYDVLTGVFALDQTVYKFAQKSSVTSRYAIHNRGDQEKVRFQPTLNFFHKPEQTDKKSSNLSSTQLLALQFFNRNGETTLNENFSLDELKTSYRRLAKKFHPDRHSDLSLAEKNKFQEKFVLLKTCFDLLR